MTFVGHWLGKKLSLKHRQNMSDAHMGYKPTEEQNRKISVALTGIKRSEETKKKMSLGKEGIVFSDEHKEKLRQAKLGGKLSEQHRENMSKAQKKCLYNTGRLKKGHNLSGGSKNWNWKGGITPLRVQITSTFEYRQWRSDVFTRDDFTCQECGKRAIKLNAHHINSVGDIFLLGDIKTIKQALDCDELWNINNGITLCTKCHGGQHRAVAILQTKQIFRN